MKNLKRTWKKELQLLSEATSTSRCFYNKESSNCNSTINFSHAEGKNLFLNKSFIMYNKIFFIISFLFCNTLQSQDKRFFYQYDYYPDSTDVQLKKTEVMFLDIFKEKSEFFSQTKLASDSLLAEADRTGKYAMSFKDMNNTYKIIKSINGEVVYENTELEMGRIVIKDDRKINWKILKDKKQINNYTVQKAKAFFAGREWEAWFTTEIPINDGPYKFHGLPGFIVNIADVKLQHQFTLMGNKNLEASYRYPDLKEKKIELSLEKYKELLNFYRNDPASKIRMKYMAGKIPHQRDHNGNTVSGMDIVLRVEKSLKEKISKDNNIIEIDLLRY
ncbi:GLPGLI family protein [Kaistella flava (ex Peng et al. 2021)]|uniref:GLPGLI family protein n=1 Tax=Kaistella flava (ex Peng et al. 2021) TaxID=2038776 RepID=A0A7M2Y8A1_9FLAO|nr:GLPGLI family protein [Kaistella flava (ex Peng et al. 2021)]QOW09855.1 GLPGLI family protein [Kaistella flava (ex Peng et al. 2021)]